MNWTKDVNESASSFDVIGGALTYEIFGLYGYMEYIITVACKSGKGAGAHSTIYVSTDEDGKSKSLAISQLLCMESS